MSQCEEEMAQCHAQFKQKVFEIQSLYSNNHSKLNTIQQSMRGILEKSNDLALSQQYASVKSKEAQIQSVIGQIMQKLGDKAYIDLKQSEFFSKVKGIKTQQQEMKEDLGYVKT